MVEASIASSPIVLTETLQPVTNIWSMPGSVPRLQEPVLNLLAFPERLTELPDWLCAPLIRFLRLKQRNWPASTVKRSTRQIFSRLYHMLTFFIQHHNWNEWHQLNPRWLDNYIDTRLRDGRAPGTINWDLSNFLVFCRFLIEEGYKVPEVILKMKFLDTPRHLPRPLFGEQVRRLESCIQAAITEAKTDILRILAVRDLACFYLLWHCGLRISEVCSLALNDIDMESRKLFIRNSKERKDRVVYMSDTTALALKQHLAIRPDQDSVYLFPIKGRTMTTRNLQRRLVYYGMQCNVPVTAHRLRHTFASQMLAVGMPVTSLQRFLGHDHLDTTMLYAEVSDPMLRQDYYKGIAALDPTSNLPSHDLELSHQDTLRQLIEELKMPGLEVVRREDILGQMQRLLESVDQ